MPRRRRQLPPNQNTLPFADPANVLEHIALFGSDLSYHPRKTPVPTDHEPGTLHRVEIYAQRLAAGEDLWHPDDKQIELPATGFDALIASLGPQFGDAARSDPKTQGDLKIRQSLSPKPDS
ncbi:hypothetical protein [Roseiconus lacunae]|uniref:Uncharacterized protein n=1 Tax=Roseiconus lacunae TaxID=2605694 RepID=A0ABT7PDP0_9BACT|nr:hypothetical protein [Roseiconus lacunae]MDM4014619.1 hypothetical protein [Roseiconus lacunae]